MATYYVDSAAGGGGDGSIGTPWNTLASVEAAVLAPGDTVKLKRGSIFREDLILNETGSLGNPITIEDYGAGLLPAISGANVIAGWTNEAGNIWYATVPAYATHIVIFDGTLGNEKSSKAALAAEFDWWYDSAGPRVYCYSPADPDARYTSPGVEVGTSRWIISTNYGTNISYYTIKNLRLYGSSGSPAIHTTTTYGWTIDTLWVEQMNRTGFQMIEARDLTIQNCTMVGYRAAATGWKAIYVYPSSSTGLRNITIKNNTINYWGSYGIHVMGYSSAQRTVNVAIEDNDVKHNGTGIYCSYLDGGTIHSNDCDDAALGGDASVEVYGIAFQTVSNFLVDYNICTNGRCGMEIWAYTGALWPLSGPSRNNIVQYNSFCLNSREGFLIYEGNANGTIFRRNIVIGNTLDGAAIGDHNAGYESTNCIMEFNSFLGNGTSGTDYADMRFTYACAGWTVRYNAAKNTNRNCYRSATAATATTHYRNVYYRAAGTVIYNNGTSYDLAHVLDFEPDARAADPLYTSEVAPYDLDIQAGSPCIDIAVGVYDALPDYLGRPIV